MQFIKLYIILFALCLSLPSYAKDNPAPQKEISKAEKMPDFVGLATYRKEEKEHVGTSVENDPHIMQIITYYKFHPQMYNIAGRFKGIDLQKDGTEISRRHNDEERNKERYMPLIVKEGEQYYIVHVYYMTETFRIMHAMKLHDGEFMPVRGDLLREVKLPELYERLSFFFKRTSPVITK